MGVDEVALATPDLRYLPPPRNILRASSACCEEGCSNEENDPYPPRLNGPAPLSCADSPYVFVYDRKALAVKRSYVTQPSPAHLTWLFDNALSSRSATAADRVGDLQAVT